MLRASQWTAPNRRGMRGDRFYDARYRTYVAKILPGDCVATREDIALATTLGSCVSACIRDPIAGVGGMNHFMLPESELSGAGRGSARYGSYAMEVLINELMKRGAVRGNLEAKVFGGGNVLRSIASCDVGERNAEFVRGYLAAEQLAIAAQDLGGFQARKLLYFPRSGRALVRRLPVAQTASEAREEQRYLKRLGAAPVAGGVELFE